MSAGLFEGPGPTRLGRRPNDGEDAVPIHPVFTCRTSTPSPTYHPRGILRARMPQRDQPPLSRCVTRIPFSGSNTPPPHQHTNASTYRSSPPRPQCVNAFFRHPFVLNGRVFGFLSKKKRSILI